MTRASELAALRRMYPIKWPVAQPMETGPAPEPVTRHHVTSHVAAATDRDTLDRHSTGAAPHVD